MEVSLTGSKGFFGQNLSKHLEDFHLSYMSLRFQSGQIMYLVNPDAIIHLSGKAHDLKKVPQPQDYYDANFELNEQLYNAFIKSAAKKFILISSVKASGVNVLTEDQTANQQTDLGYLDSPMILLDYKLRRFQQNYRFDAGRKTDTSGV